MQAYKEQEFFLLIPVLKTERVVFYRTKKISKKNLIPCIFIIPDFVEQGFFGLQNYAK